MPGITISAGYGAGGSVIAPAVAATLGYPLLDRAISSQVADHLKVSTEEAQTAILKRGVFERYFAMLAPLVGGGVAGNEALARLNAAGEFRDDAEAIMREALVDGAVVLGRAGACALRDQPGVLRVRLFGPVAARAAQAAELEQIDAAAAEQRMSGVDRARAQYVRRLYGRDIDDPDLYHLQLDSTAIPREACVELICAAYAALVRQPADSAS